MSAQINKDKDLRRDNKRQARILGVSLLILFFTLLCLLFPVATIWALNNLFHLQIAYTVKNWLSIIILILTLQASLKIKGKQINIK